MLPNSAVSRRGFLGTSIAFVTGAPTGVLGSLARTRFFGSRRSETPGPEGLRLRGPANEDYWRRVRSQFLLDNNIAFFNNGTAGPTSAAVIDAHEHYDREIARHPYDSLHMKDIVPLRQRLAEFVNAAPEEVFFTHSTTDGMNIFAHGLEWKAGDEVLMARHEHPGGYQVYQTLEKRYGIKIVWLDLPSPPQSREEIVAIYRKAITSKTRLIVVSHITFVTGLLMPVKELTALAHEQGLLISVDGAQSFGVLPLDLKEAGFDHYAAPGQKWLMAGTGSGFTYIARSLQSKVWPLHGFDDIKAPPPYPINRYERSGQPNMPAWFGMKPALELQMAIGKENIEQRARQLAGRLRAGLREIPGIKLLTSGDPGLSAALTTFILPNMDPDAVVRALIDRERIYIRSIIEEDIKAVRASAHIYNSPEQVDRLLAAVRRLATGRSGTQG